MICLSVEVRATCISVRRLEGCNTTCAYVLVDVCDFFQSPPLYLNVHFSQFQPSMIDHSLKMLKQKTPETICFALCFFCTVWGNLCGTAPVPSCQRYEPSLYSAFPRCIPARLSPTAVVSRLAAVASVRGYNQSIPGCYYYQFPTVLNRHILILGPCGQDTYGISTVSSTWYRVGLSLDSF